jgi:hypothetical protein
LTHGKKYKIDILIKKNYLKKISGTTISKHLYFLASLAGQAMSFRHRFWLALPSLASQQQG